MDTGKPMITVSGVRGVIGQTLTARLALRLGEALGVLLAERRAGAAAPLRVAVGRDSRPSGPMIQSAFTAGLLSAGVQVTDLGVAATPSIALMVRFLGVDAGAVITASHNPAEYNGLKFLGSDGRGFSSRAMGRLESLVDNPGALETSPPACAPAHLGGPGRVVADSRSHAYHVQSILKHVDARLIAQYRYRVVLDSINGAGCMAAAMLLGKLGVELVHINGEATGQFAHGPEPTGENLATLGAMVTRHRAAIGLAQDPDADRLAIIDEQGRYIGEEYTLALAVRHRLGQLGPSTAAAPTIVCNLSTSRMIDDLAARFGGRVVRTPVGEAHVADAMLQTGAVIGGEGNGGVIDPRLGPVRDSFVAMALLLELLAQTQKTVSELVAEIPAYVMLKKKFPATRQQAAQWVEQARREFAGARMDLQDGVRIDQPEGWLHVRPSNTEPLVRVIAEAVDQAAAEQLLRRVQH